MAIYYHRANILGRSAGRNAVRSAAYRSAEKLLDERSGEAFSYTKKQGVEHKEIMAPEHAPSWVYDRAQLWSQVELCEVRHDAQLAREIQIALPVELTPDQQVELLREHVREQFVSAGMIADVCIHRNDPKNPHAHVMLTMRSIGPAGFGNKVREWNDTDLYEIWREEWADAANRALEREGHDMRIDHRSYAEQGVGIEPQIHTGNTANHEDGRDIVRERMAQHDAIAFQNGEAIIADPSIALDTITRQRATFTRTDVGRWLNTHTLDAAQFEVALLKVMASPELVRLAARDRQGNIRYTTREMQAVEQRMLEAAQGLANDKVHAVTERHQHQSERVASLSADQRQAFDYIMQPGNLAAVQGRAGTGKSFMLGAAREAWQAEGYRVIGAALAGKAAEGLQESAGIESRTLHAWEKAWETGRDTLTRKDVLVIDEAGMLGSRQLGRVIERAHEAGAKVVLVGDDRQLQPIDAGAAFRAIKERVGQVEMADIRRQKVEWQKEATNDLFEGRVDKALAAYAERGHIHDHQTKDEARRAMVDAWDAHRQAAPADKQIMLALERKDVHELNELARERMRGAGALGRDVHIETENGQRDFAVGDRVYFLRNDYRLGQSERSREPVVTNGTLGTVERMKDDEMRVRLDDGRRITFDPQQYNHLDHGYAGTVHKGQGITVDRAHVLAGEYFNHEAVYVAMSRHQGERGQADLHWSHDVFKDERAMVDALSRERPQGIVADFNQAAEDNRKLAAEIAKTKAPEPAKREISPEDRARFREQGQEGLKQLRRDVIKQLGKENVQQLHADRAARLEQQKQQELQKQLDRQPQLQLKIERDGWERGR